MQDADSVLGPKLQNPTSGDSAKDNGGNISSARLHAQNRGRD